MSALGQITPTASREFLSERAIDRPEESGTERRIAAAIFLLSFVYLYIFRRYATMEPDEGIILEGAQRILNGEVLYRDFFSFYTPGSYYFVALILKILGNSFVVARTALVVVGAIYSVVTYLLARRVCSRTTCLLVVGLMGTTTLPFRFLVLHNWDSTLWACLAVYCSVRSLESPHWRWPLAAGSFTSLTLLFEQSKGVGLGLGLAAGFLILVLSRAKLRFSTSQILSFAAGLLWPFLLTFAYFGAHHALGAMLADWLWPLEHYSLANRVPYGYQNWSDETRHELFGTGSLVVRVITVVTMSPCFLVPVLPLLAVGLGIYWTIRTLQGRTDRGKGSYYVLLCASLSGLLLSVVVVRADIIHFMYLQPLFCLVLAWIFDGRDIPGGVFRAIRRAVIAYIVVAFALFSVPLLMRTAGASNQIATRRGQVRTPREDTVVPYIQQHVAAGEAMLVYPYLPLYQYLTATSAPSRLEYFQPGMNTTEQAREIISAMASRRVRVVLFEASFVQKIPSSWPQTPLSAVVNDPVADYILREYRNCRILKSPSDWIFLFMVRRELACPET
jgi:4-amino-4-deoxy-L-arabinose transferase-like glycosyltransferase